MKKRESKSRKGLGLIEIKNQLINQKGEVALQAVPTMLIARKDPSEGN
jgi:acyl dehydratase